MKMRWNPEFSELASVATAVTSYLVTKIGLILIITFSDDSSTVGNQGTPLAFFPLKLPEKH